MYLRRREGGRVKAHTDVAQMLSSRRRPRKTPPFSISPALPWGPEAPTAEFRTLPSGLPDACLPLGNLLERAGSGDIWVLVKEFNLSYHDRDL